MNRKKNQKKDLQPRQFVCYEILNFRPTTEQPVETVKFIFHGPYQKGNVKSPEFHMPYLVASREFVMGSEELLNFLSDWFGRKIDANVKLNYEIIRSVIIGKRRAINAMLRTSTLVNTTYIHKIAPYKGTNPLWPIIGLNVPDYLCNRVNFEYEDIGLHKLNTILSAPPKNEEILTTPIPSFPVQSNIEYTPIISEIDIQCNINALESYAGKNINTSDSAVQKLITELAKKYTGDEIEELRFALKAGMEFKSIFDIAEFLGLKRQNKI